MNEEYNFTPDDLTQHVIKFGFDLFPPIRVNTDQIALQNMFDDLQSELPKFFQEIKLNSQANLFAASANFANPAGGSSAQVQTASLIDRGLVFIMPAEFPTPIGRIAEESDVFEAFDKILPILKKAFPKTTILRMGVVREVVFTSTSPTGPYLTNRYGSFPPAEPKGGRVIVAFSDQRCNIRVTMESLQMETEHRHGAGNIPMGKELSHALGVNFDVNNIQMVAQEINDIEMTIERARSLWPTKLLEFLNWRAST